MVLVHCTYGVCWLMGNIVAKYHDFLVYNFQRGPKCWQVTTKGRDPEVDIEEMPGTIS